METEQTAASISRNDFIRNLGDSKLLSEDEFRQFVESQPADADAKVLAARLVELGKLTPFQITCASRRQFEMLWIAGYEVLELLGKGGMGAVYKARHRRMKRVAAVKVLSA